MVATALNISAFFFFFTLLESCCFSRSSFIMASFSATTSFSFWIRHLFSGVPLSSCCLGLCLWLLVCALCCWPSCFSTVCIWLCCFCQGLTKQGCGKGRAQNISLFPTFILSESLLAEHPQARCHVYPSLIRRKSAFSEFWFPRTEFCSWL